MRYRDLKPSQRRALRRIIRFYIDNTDHVTSVRFKLKGTDYGPVWVSVKTRRSDCHPSSPRAIVLEQYAHIYIGPKGKVEVFWSQIGLTHNERFVARMLGGQVGRP